MSACGFGQTPRQRPPASKLLQCGAVLRQLLDTCLHNDNALAAWRQAKVQEDWLLDACGSWPQHPEVFVLVAGRLLEVTIMFFDCVLALVVYLLPKIGAKSVLPTRSSWFWCTGGFNLLGRPLLPFYS